jgi:hypothetical protein
MKQKIKTNQKNKKEIKRDPIILMLAIILIIYSYHIFDYRNFYKVTLSIICITAALYLVTAYYYKVKL